MIKQLVDCQKCGSRCGWYERVVHSGEQYYNENGSADCWEGQRSRGGKKKYCAQCGADITNKIGHGSA